MCFAVVIISFGDDSFSPANWLSVEPSTNKSSPFVKDARRPLVIDNYMAVTTRRTHSRGNEEVSFGKEKRRTFF